MTATTAAPAQRFAPWGAVAAVSADEELIGSDPQHRAGRVHSVFDKAVNIATAGGTLIALTVHNAPDAPASIRIDLDTFAGLSLCPGDRVVADADLLQAGDHLIVDLAAAAAWQPRVTPGPVVPERVRRAETALAALRVAGGAVRGEGPFAAAIADRVESALNVIGAAVAARDTTAVRAAAATLVGLGVGLTPTGDDVLTGLAFAAWHLGGPLGLVPSAVTEAAATGTTHDLSLAMLRHACRGRAAQPLVTLLSMLRDDGEPEPGDADIDSAVAAIIGIGHTSGTDQACGLIAAVHISERIRGRS